MVEKDTEPLNLEAVKEIIEQNPKLRVHRIEEHRYTVLFVVDGGHYVEGRGFPRVEIHVAKEMLDGDGPEGAAFYVSREAEEYIADLVAEATDPIT